MVPALAAAQPRPYIRPEAGSGTIPNQNLGSEAGAETGPVLTIAEEEDFEYG